MADSENSSIPRETAVIIGAGPAGLTAALELIERTGIHPIVLEATDMVGGIARTVNYKGNRIDIGGHRFFSKSDRVMDWWLRILPLQHVEDRSQTITYQRRSRTVESTARGPDPEREDRVMLLRRRRSRIYFARRFFDYPISLSPATLRNLGVVRSARIGLSYLRSALLPIRPERNLEEFFINRFGRELYRTFFKSYTEKVWGVPCEEISAEWGAQRVKGLSIAKAILHFVRGLLPSRGDVAQKKTETSLIEQFLYPKYGPGQMWEEVAQRLLARGAEIRMSTKAVSILTSPDGRIRAVRARDAGGYETEIPADWVFSSMPVRSLVAALDCEVPPEVAAVARGLQYRDFVTVGLLYDRLQVRERDGGLVSDNWIYIQEPDVLLGRVQIFQNWSPWMVADPAKVWLGLEYFCNEGDELWSLADEKLIELGAEELERIAMARRADLRDGVVIRMPKAYPAYFGSWADFEKVRAVTDRIPNLFLVGRNGMHRYNNQDHSMLAAMVAVDNIVEGRADKANIWDVNTEEDYLEEK